MMSKALESQLKLIAQAQAEYQNAITNHSAANADFWLRHLQGLCQQAEWLQDATDSQSITTKMPVPQTEMQVLRLPQQAEFPISITPIPPPMPTALPTAYTWNDGFIGVTLNNVWDEGN